MKLTIFAKTGTTKDGRKFDRYIGRLPKKGGEELTVAVKFREECGKPKSFPCNIIVSKNDANLTHPKYVREDTGETVEGNTLWVSAWKMGDPYVDHSLDDFED